MKYVFMIRNECGEEYRAYGSDFLEKEHEFPDYDSEDDAMQDAFWAWKDTMTQKANDEYHEKHGPEAYIFMEVLWSDYYKKRGYAILRDEY